MSIENFLHMTIKADGTAASLPGFGTPLICAFHEKWTDVRVHEYADADELLDEGFTTDDAIYKLATIVKEQDPAPDTFKVGRRAITHATTFDPAGHLTAGTPIAQVVDNKPISLVVSQGSGGNLADVCDDLVVAFQAALPGYLVTTDGTVVTVTAPNGVVPILASLLTQALDPGANTATGNVLSCTIDGHAVSHTVTSGENGVKASVCAGLVANIQSALPTYVVFTDGTEIYVSKPNGTAPTVASLTLLTAAPATIHNLATTPVTLGPPRQTIDLIPTQLSSGFTYKGVIGGKPFTYQIASGDAGNLASVCTALAAVLSSLSLPATVTAASGYVEIQANTGTILAYSLGTLGKPATMKIKDVTADTTLAADLTAINEEDADWYGLLLDVNSSASIIEAAQFIETKRKVCYVQSADWDIKDPAQTEDPASLLMAGSYSRTGLIYHGFIGGSEWLAAGQLGGRLAVDPGKQNFSFKKVVGVTPDKLKQGEENAIFAKNASDYTTMAKLNLTYGGGKSGSGEYLDTVRGIDWIYANVTLAVINLLAGNDKIPYTDAGVDNFCTVILGVLQTAVKMGILAPTPAPYCTGPKVADVPDSLRKQRILPDLDFGGQLAGAIEDLDPVTGTISI